MHEHFHLDGEDEESWAVRVGRHCAYLLFIGIFACISLSLVALGVAAVRWAW